MIRFTIMFVVDATTTTPRWQRCYRLQGARSLPKRSEECHLKGGFTMSAIANGTAVSETSRPSVGSPGVFTSRKRGGVCVRHELGRAANTDRRSRQIPRSHFRYRL